MSVATDTLPELNCVAAFLECADSPRARNHLLAKLRHIQKAHSAGDRVKLRYLSSSF
jgi:hypothetical protein